MQCVQTGAAVHRSFSRRGFMTAQARKCKMDLAILSEMFKEADFEVPCTPTLRL